jgi:hypothetical protein
MKVMLLATLFITTGSFAQSLDVNALKSLLTQKKAVLEKVNPGMSKKLTTVTKIPTELGPCELTETSVQTVLKIEGDKMIVHSKETYSPASTTACAGFESQTLGVIFYEEKPALAKDLEDLDESASQIKSIMKSGEIVTLNLSAPVTNEDGTTKLEAVTVKYDLTKSSFKNTLLIQDSTSTVTGTDLSDIDVYSIDLRKVLFCESADSDKCSEGDWSDVLF